MGLDHLVHGREVFIEEFDGDGWRHPFQDGGIRGQIRKREGDPACLSVQFAVLREDFVGEGFTEVPLEGLVHQVPGLFNRHRFGVVSSTVLLGSPFVPRQDNKRDKRRREILVVSPSCLMMAGPDAMVIKMAIEMANINRSGIKMKMNT